MADAGEQATGQSLTPEVRLEHIYLKDASFESPMSPQVFGESLEPRLQVDFNASTKPLGSPRYEVILTTRIEGKVQDGQTAFIIEVQQAGIFGFDGFDEQQIHQVMGTFCLTTLFPYVRETIDSFAMRGGLPPLKLAPINFEALYAQGVLRAQQAQQTQEPQASGQTSPSPSPQP